MVTFGYIGFAAELVCAIVCAMERDIEARLRKSWVALKLSPVGNTGVPDRVVLKPVPDEHREIVSRYVRFVEVKTPTGRVSQKQRYWIERLRKMGFVAEVWRGT